MASNFSSLLPGQLCVSGILLAALLCMCIPPGPPRSGRRTVHSVRQHSVPAPGRSPWVPYGTMCSDNTLTTTITSPPRAFLTPIEPWNRFWFHFNDIFFIYVARPAYSAWETVTPHSVARRVEKFFSNLLFRAVCEQYFAVPLF